MRRHLLTVLAGSVAFLILANPARAEEKQAEDIAPIFCKALKDPAQYDRNNFSAYKMLVAGTDGWIFRTESDMRKDFTINRDTMSDLEELNQVFKKRDRTLVMLIPPTRAMMHYDHINPSDRNKYGIGNIDSVWRAYRAMLAGLRNHGIHAIGIERPESDDQPFFYKRDHHWTPEGARTAAQAVAAYVKTLPAYQDIGKIDYKTVEHGTIDIHGVSKKVFRKLCGTDQPPERAALYKTTRTDVANGENALFGQADPPGVALVGTSNSTMLPSYANFEGFLKEALSADIVNLSVSGGGLGAAMISYLDSPFYGKNPPSIIVWEIPGYYDLNRESRFFREAIAGAYGICDNPVAETKGQKITFDNFLLLGDLAGKKINGNDYYLALKFRKPVARPFSVDFRYAHDRDKYRFRHSARAPHDSAFFLELKPDEDGDLEKIVMSVPPELRGETLDAMVCRKNRGGFFAAVGEPGGGSGVFGMLKGLGHSLGNFAKERRWINSR